MRLIIPLYMGNDFVQYIISDMYRWISDNLDIERLSEAQNYINTDASYKSIYIPSINLYDICKVLPSNIHVDTYQEYYELSIDTNVTVYGTFIKVKDVINLINYGNLAVKPYPIFDYMFSYYSNNLNNLFDNFSGGV